MVELVDLVFDSDRVPAGGFRWGVVSGARVQDRYQFWRGYGPLLRSLGWRPVVSCSASECWRTMGLLEGCGWVGGIVVSGASIGQVAAWATFVEQQRCRRGRGRWRDARLFVDCDPTPGLTFGTTVQWPSQWRYMS